MPYPDSPFPSTFSTDVLINLNETSHLAIQNDKLSKTLKWLCTSPKITSFRVNKTNSSLQLERKKHDVQSKLSEFLGNKPVKVEIHPTISDVIILKHWDVNPDQMERFKHEVIVDVDCASAILRGAHIFAPGVLGMLSGTQIGDTVSVYADMSKNCKKGLNKKYQGEKLFVGNGLVKIKRNELFGENLKPSGIAIEIFETISGCPSFGKIFDHDTTLLLQNLPSIICVLNLDPQENEQILDMCAAPGNKTTHIADLINNRGTIIALDKNKARVKQLEENCKRHSSNVKCYVADSVNILRQDQNKEGLMFDAESFDRILLDAPCSGLGKRPQLLNTITEKVVRSYVPLQRKLFETAVELLKENKTLVYSTCSVTLAENEGIVAWALKKFKFLKLVEQKIYIGKPGWPGTTLTDEERLLVQRFGPDDIDSVGFFIACFTKEYQ